jgi:ankyrin repeat protein
MGMIPCRTCDNLVNLHARSKCGDTLFHVAVERNNIAEIRYLFESGLNINLQGDFMETPLHLAAHRGNQNLFNQLLKMGADPDIRDSSGRRPRDVLNL